MFHVGENIHGGVAGLRAEQVQAAHRLEIAKVFDSFIGDAGAGEVEFLKVGETRQVLQTFVGDERVAQHEAAEIFEGGEPGHAFVGEGIVAEIQICSFAKARG